MHVVEEAVEARAARGKERRYILLGSAVVCLKHARIQQLYDLPKLRAPEPLSDQVD